MEQQDAKNLITLEQFLESLKDIIGSFKNYVDTTNARIDSMQKTINDLSNRINENTSITREFKKDFGNKLDNLFFENLTKTDFEKHFDELIAQIKKIESGKKEVSDAKKKTQKKTTNNKQNG